MLYGVKLSEEELFMAKKESVEFYMVKRFEKILKWKFLSIKEGGEGGIY